MSDPLTRGTGLLQSLNTLPSPLHNRGMVVQLVDKIAGAMHPVKHLGAP